MLSAPRGDVCLCAGFLDDISGKIGFFYDGRTRRQAIIAIIRIEGVEGGRVCDLFDEDRSSSVANFARVCVTVCVFYVCVYIYESAKRWTSGMAVGKVHCSHGLMIT